jgi:hypothetical protein
MVSDFSKNLVKLFLENNGVVNPDAVMVAAITGVEYQKLAVTDWCGAMSWVVNLDLSEFRALTLLCRCYSHDH